MDRGDLDSLDDVVAALRALVAVGKGNASLLKLMRDKSIDPAMPRTSEPADASPDVQFSLGAVPAPDNSSKDGVTPPSMTALMGMRCLTVRTKADLDDTYTWDRLVREVANKQGAVHSDAEVPLAFDELTTIGVADQDAVAYGLRHLGVAVSRIAHRVLEDAAPPFSIPIGGHPWMGGIRVAKPDSDGETKIEVTFDPGPVVPGLTALFDLPVRPRPAPAKVGRNDTCPCGSGLKFKKCHGG